MVLVTLEGAASDADHDAHLVLLAKIATDLRPHVCILHAREGSTLSARQRQRYAAWLDEHRAMLSANCVGHGFVFESPSQRFMLSGILLQTRMPCPHVVLSTLAEAQAWAAERLAAARASRGRR